MEFNFFRLFFLTIFREMILTINWSGYFRWRKSLEVVNWNWLKWRCNKILVTDHTPNFLSGYFYRLFLRAISVGYHYHPKLNTKLKLCRLLDIVNRSRSEWTPFEDILIGTFMLKTLGLFICLMIWVGWPASELTSLKGILIRYRNY